MKVHLDSVQCMQQLWCKNELKQESKSKTVKSISSKCFISNKLLQPPSMDKTNFHSDHQHFSLSLEENNEVGHFALKSGKETLLPFTNVLGGGLKIFSAMLEEDSSFQYLTQRKGNPTEKC